MNFKCLIFLTLLMAAGSDAQTSSDAKTDSLVQWSAQILGEMSAQNWDQNQCVPYLSALGAKLDTINSTELTREELQAVAESIITHLWQSRLALHQKLSGASNDCAKEIRNTFRRFRFLEDFLGEIEFKVKDLNPLHDGRKNKEIDFKQQATPIDQMAEGYFLQTADQSFHLQPGDLIIARGVSFLSAMISRLGDTDSQFSHVIMVTENPKTKAIETIESYVGVGVAIYDRTTALKNENARLLVLRPKDQALAKLASEQMRAFVASHQGKNKIHYDYSLDFTEHSTMSCAEVAQVAFLNASDQKFQLPERPSRLNRGLDLLNRLGIKAGDTFTPGDLEADSRFDIVGEWRDLRMTHDSRIKDSILTKVLEWMDQDDAHLIPDLNSKLAGGLIYDLRRIPLIWPLVRLIGGIPDFSKEVPRRMISTVALISDLGEALQKELSARDQAYRAKTGLSMTYLQLYQELENIRAEEHSIVFNYLN